MISGSEANTFRCEVFFITGIGLTGATLNHFYGLVTVFTNAQHAGEPNKWP